MSITSKEPAVVDKPFVEQLRANRPAVLRKQCIGMKQSKRDIVEEALREKRRFRRIRLSRIGRVYFPETAEEAPCRLEDISAGGAFLHCKFLRRPRGQAIVRLGQFGQLEGQITAIKNDAFSMAFTYSKQKRDKLVDRLTIEINRHLLEPDDAG